LQVDHVKLRELAAWYREQAEQAANPVIWDARLRTADDLDKEADRLEARTVSHIVEYGKQLDTQGD
jgi:hypothetical protein